MSAVAGNEASLSLPYWVTLLLTVPTSFMLIRLFIIQHDCGHGAFFRHRLANDWVGRALGVLTLTPQHAHRKAGMTFKSFWLRKLLQNFWRPT